MTEEKSIEYLNNIETIFKLLGTQSQPNENRQKLIQMINCYSVACGKIEVFTAIKEEIQKLFKEYPQLSLFQLSIYHDESSYCIGNIFLDIKNFDSNQDSILEEIRELLDYHSEVLAYLFKNNRTIIDRDNINTIFSKILTSEEQTVFYDIENFEKHKLEKEISVYNKKDKALKI